MRRVGPLLLLLSLAASAADDREIARYKQFFRENIRGQWATEELSEQRVLMVRGFDKYDVPPAAKWLILEVLAKEEAADVIREAVRVLGKYKKPDTLEEINALYAGKLKKLWEARAFIQLAYAKTKLDQADKIVRQGLGAKEPRLVVAALRAVGSGRRIMLAEQVVKLLKHKHRAVRGAAADALAELRHSEAMPAIFPLFCHDPSHRARFDSWLAMKALSKENFPCAPEAWQGWWESQVSEIPEEGPNPWGRFFPRTVKSADKCGSFFGIPVLGERIIFVLDVSMSFDDAWKINHKKERKKPRTERIPNFFSVKTRWDLVRNYAMDCLKNLPEETELSFVFFRHEIDLHPPKGKFLKNSPKNRGKIKEVLEEAKRGGGSAMFEAFQAAFGFIRDAHPLHNFNKGADTILFVTDSFVKDGALANKGDRLRDEIWRVAVMRNIRVHTVGLHNHDFDLCKGIAKDCGGLYVHAQQEGDPAEPQDLDFWPEKKKAFEKSRRKRRQ
ncbi:MAG: hypothetical protein ACYTGV_04855 [Planctomycetota bacterium]|jgi:hypothetical protein